MYIPSSIGSTLKSAPSEGPMLLEQNFTKTAQLTYRRTVPAQFLYSELLPALPTIHPPHFPVSFSCLFQFFSSFNHLPKHCAASFYSKKCEKVCCFFSILLHVCLWHHGVSHSNLWRSWCPCHHHPDTCQDVDTVFLSLAPPLLLHYTVNSIFKLQFL